MLWLSAALAGSYGALCLGAYLGQRALIYPAPPRRELPPEIQSRWIRVPLPSGSGLARFEPGEPSAPVVVHFHGNGEDLLHVELLGRHFKKCGIGFFAVEYPGYGGLAHAEPSESALYDHAAAGLDYLEHELGVPRGRVVLQGQSLGSGVAVEMAHRGYGSRLILLSPFTSMVDMAKTVLPWLPVGWLVRDRYDSVNKAAAIQLPTWIVHGTEDEVIPFRMSEALQRRFQSASLYPIVGAHHNDLFGAALPGLSQSGLTELLCAFARGDRVP